MLVENRETAYEALFKGELPYEPQPSMEEVGLSGLWRIYTQKRGGSGEALHRHLDMVPAAVKDTLVEHDTNAHSTTPDGESVFGVLTTEGLEVVVDVTSQIVTTWEKALWRNGERPLIAASHRWRSDGKQARTEHAAHTSAAKSLIVEAASAVIQTLPTWSKDPTNPTIRERTTLAKVLANWGPQFLAEWMNGAILARWLKEQGTPDDEIADWQAVFTPNARKSLAINQVHDPLGALVRVKENMSQLTDEAIAERLGWSEEEVRLTITPSTRKHYALNYLSNPFVGLGKFKANLELLTDEAIAERLGWSEEEVRRRITPGDRKFFSVQYANDPLDALNRFKANLELLTDEAIAERLGWSEEEAAEISQSTRKHFSYINIGNPLTALDRVKENMLQLTDEAIAERLGWSEDKVRTCFPQSTRRYFAFNNIKDPFTALDQTAANLELLTDEAIAERLGWSEEEVRRRITPGARRFFAARSRRDDPLRTIQAWVNGEITFQTSVVVNLRPTPSEWTSQ